MFVLTRSVFLFCIQLIASNYLSVLAPSAGYSTVPGQWLNDIGFRNDLSLGVMLSVTMPVEGPQGLLLGVLGMDIALSDVLLCK